MVCMIETHLQSTIMYLPFKKSNSLLQVTYFDLPICMIRASRICVNLYELIYRIKKLHTVQKTLDKNNVLWKPHEIKMKKNKRAYFYKKKSNLTSILRPLADDLVENFTNTKKSLSKCSKFDNKQLY